MDDTYQPVRFGAFKAKFAGCHADAFFGAVCVYPAEGVDFCCNLQRKSRLLFLLDRQINPALNLDAALLNGEDLQAI